MDSIQNIAFKKDTTLALLLAAQEKGLELFYMEQHDLALHNGAPEATMRPLQVFNDPGNWCQLDEQQLKPLESLDVILMRKDPPFDSEYIYSTYVLEAAEKRGVKVVNKPQSLRDCNEKVFATRFPQCCPPLLVSRDAERLRRFHREHGDVIYKPLDGMGGASIFRARSDELNLNVIIETLTQYGRQTIMAQKFIPEISRGDKRILMVNGKPVPYCLARIPPEGDIRGNLAAGGTGVVQPLTDRDRWIAAQVAPTLKEKGLLFVGLDVIGKYLTEINVTSPTCVREIDNAQNINIGSLLMEAIAAL